MIEELTRHQIYLQRYSGGVLKDMLPTLRQLRNDVANRIAIATEYESARLSLLMADINMIIDGHFTPLTNTIFNSVDELAVYEQQYALNLLDKNTIASVLIGAGAQPELLKAFVRNTALNMAGEAPMTISTMIDTFNKAYKSDIKTILSTGLLEGKTTVEMAREVNRVSNGRSYNQAEALVRTIVNHTGATARKSAFSPTPELYKGERYVATLDSRVTILCAGLDGKIFPIGVGPQTPQHWNCRSLRVLELKDEYKIIQDGTRSSVDGPVSAKLTYAGWLKKQSKAVQNEVLGAERAELFRSGKVTLDKFTDNTGRTYTLKELELADSIT